MIPLDIALHLIAHRQAALAEPQRGLRRRMLAAARDDLAVWAAHLQTRPDELVQILTILVGDLAATRNERGLPTLDVRAPTVAVPDLPLELHGPPDEHELLDRLGSMLGGFRDWEIRVQLDDGSTVTARPARAPLAPEQAPAGVTG